MSAANSRISHPFLCLCLLALAPLLVSKPLQAQQPPSEAGVQLEAGIEKEDVIGDLKSAMEIYQRIAADNLASREVRARALLRLAGCDEKLGRPAKQIYEQIVREFADHSSSTESQGVTSFPKARSSPAARPPKASLAFAQTNDRSFGQYVGETLSGPFSFCAWEG